MNTREFDEDVNEMEEFGVDTVLAPETNPSTKLERRRKVEDLFEEKRLREELEDYA